MTKNENIKIRIIISYSLLVFWAVVIFLFSAKDADASTEQSNIILQIISRITGITMQENAFWAVMETIVRKLAHLSIYLVLGFLATNALRYTAVSRKEFKYALIICVLYAISDEVHQYFVPGRACRFYDVIVDTFGACIGISMFSVIRKHYLKLFKRS